MDKRRSFFRKALFSIAGLGAAPVLLSAQEKAKKVDGRFMHMVFFWLRDEVDADAFRQTTENFLLQVPEIVKYHLGAPAGTPREVVDNTYTVSLVVTFNSKKDQDAYQTHPAHLKYVADNKDKWTEVKIFDSWGA